MSQKLRWDEYAVKPLVTATIGTAVLGAAVGQNVIMGSADVLGKKVPAWALSLGLMYGAGVAGELLHAYAFPDTVKNVDIKSTIASTALTAGANVAAWSIVSGGQTGSVTPFIVSGVVGQAGSDYIYEKWVKPILGY